MEENKKGCSDDQCSRESCSGCEKNKSSFLVELNRYSSIKNVIGVVSGKGGVGKSFVTAMLAVLMNRRGFKTGIMDADITGPSIPKMFGLKNKALTNEYGMLPQCTREDMKVMSINLLLPNEEDPVIWRGPILAGVVKQFWTDVYWGDLDYLFVDMPPGTGDVPLTVFQSIPLDGIVIVTSPQDLVSLIIKKAYRMAMQMNIPVLGLVENYSYVKCPDCGKEIPLFGESKITSVAKELHLPVLGKIPVEPEIAKLVDKGEFEQFQAVYLQEAADVLQYRFTEHK